MVVIDPLKTPGEGGGRDGTRGGRWTDEDKGWINQDEGRREWMRGSNSDSGHHDVDPNQGRVGGRERGGREWTSEGEKKRERWGVRYWTWRVLR